MAFGVLEWTWRLPGGEAVRARFDARVSLETVWQGGRMVSRRPSGDQSGHSITLADGRTAQLAFDTFGEDLATCTLTIDGEAVVPHSSPRRGALFRISTKGMLGSVGIMVALSIVRFVLLAPSTSRVAADAIPDSDQHLGNKEAVIYGMDTSFDRCYRDAPGVATSVPGKVLLRARIRNGAVVETTVLQADGFTNAVTDCVQRVVKGTTFFGSGTTDIPIAFPGKK